VKPTTAVFAVVAVVWIMCLWVWFVHDGARDTAISDEGPAIAVEDPLLRQLTADNQALRAENSQLRAELEDARASEPPHD